MLLSCRCAEKSLTRIRKSNLHACPKLNDSPATVAAEHSLKNIGTALAFNPGVRAGAYSIHHSQSRRTIMEHTSSEHATSHVADEVIRSDRGAATQQITVPLWLL